MVRVKIESAVPQAFAAVDAPDLQRIDAGVADREREGEIVGLRLQHGAAAEGDDHQDPVVDA